MTKTASEDLSGLCRRLPKVHVVVTARAEGKDNAMAVGSSLANIFQAASL